MKNTNLIELWFVQSLYTCLLAVCVFFSFSFVRDDYLLANIFWSITLCNQRHIRTQASRSNTMSVDAVDGTLPLSVPQPLLPSLVVHHFLFSLPTYSSAFPMRSNQFNFFHAVYHCFEDWGWFFFRRCCCRVCLLLLLLFGIYWHTIFTIQCVCVMVCI